MAATSTGHTASVAEVGSSRSAVELRDAIVLATNPPTIHPVMAPLLTMPNSRLASRVVITWLASVHTCAGRSTDATLAQTYNTGSIHAGSRTRAMNQKP